MAEYSNTDQEEKRRRQVQQWCRAECDARQSECGGSKRARATATSNLVRPQNWSGLTRSRRTNASPTKCSQFHDRARTRRPVTTRRADPTTTTTASDGQRKSVEPQRSRAASAALAKFTDNRTARRPCPSLRTELKTGPSLQPPMPRCHRPLTGRNYSTIRRIRPSVRIGH